MLARERARATSLVISRNAHAAPFTTCENSRHFYDSGSLSVIDSGNSTTRVLSSRVQGRPPMAPLGECVGGRIGKGSTASVRNRHHALAVMINWSGPQWLYVPWSVG